MTRLPIIMPLQPPASPPPTSQSDPRNILAACQMIENLCSRIYSALAIAHAADREAEFVWNKTAAEELNHAEQFAIVLRLQKSPLIGSNVHLQLAHETIAAMRRTLNAIRSSPPSVVEALRMAIALEGRLASFHLEEAAVFQDPKMKSLFRAMQSADRAHVETLEALLALRDDRSAT